MAFAVLERDNRGIAPNPDSDGTFGGIPMNVIFKATQALVSEIRSDLRRAHPYAAERVGFISCRAGRLTDGLVILAHR